MTLKEAQALQDWGDFGIFLSMKFAASVCIHCWLVLIDLTDQLQLPGC